MKRPSPPDHTIRVTYPHGSSQPVYTVAVFRVCGSKAEAQACVRQARTGKKERRGKRLRTLKDEAAEDADERPWETR